METRPVIAVDFETYYDDEVSIKTLGVDKYVEHPLTVPYMLSIVSDDLSVEFCGEMNDAPWHLLTRGVVVAHNARFDETVFLHHQRKGRISKECKPFSWRCTADLAAYLDAPRNLKGSAKELLQKDISKGYREVAKGEHVSLKSSPPELWNELRLACISDSRTCLQLWQNFSSHWPEDEQRFSAISRDQQRRGVQINVPLLEENIQALQQALHTAGNTIPWEWGGKRSKTPILVKEIGLECRKAGIPCPSSFAKDDPEAMQWEETYKDEHPWIGAVASWRKVNPLLAKLITMRTRIRDDGTLPFSVLYYGTHTGRFKASGGFNILNMPKKPTLGVDIRALVIPRPGYKFLIYDYAQIEARILLWYIGDEESLQLINEGYSVYEIHAMKTMEWKSRSGKPLKEEDPELYALAKARVLGLGYGCGRVRFVELAFKLCRLILTEEESREIVNDFRSSNWLITNLWKKVQKFAHNATQTASRQLRITLPSGRHLDYFKARYTDNGMKAEFIRGGTPKKIYGGLLTENLIQAIGFDVLRAGLLQLHDTVKEVSPLFDVYDEVVMEVPEDFTDTHAVEEAMTIFKDEWMQGLPLEVEGEESYFYKK